MRRLLISILLASAAASPALAQDRDGRDFSDSTNVDRSEAREAREQARSERVHQAEPAQAPQVEARQHNQEQTRERGNDRPHVDRAAPDAQQPAVVEADRGNRSGFNGRRGEHTQQSGESNQQAGDRSGWNGGDRNWTRRNGELRQSNRDVPNVMRSHTPLIVSNTPREGTQPPLRSESRRSWAGHWNGNWRNDHRYDWHNHRDRHRSLFHIGIYSDPFGWGYQPYEIGWRLWPSYFSSRYWINDPWMYRLPYAPPGTRWVRYWDDAILVDTFTGQVVDVIHNFFW